MIGWWSDVVKEANDGDHTPVVSHRPALRHDPVHRLRGDVLRRLVLDLLRDGAVPSPTARSRRSTRWRSAWKTWPPQGRRDGAAVRAAAGQHADAAAVGHHGDLGAPRAADRRPHGRQDRPAADHPAGDAVHLDPGLRVPPHPDRPAVLRPGRGQLGPLRLGLLHGHRLPRLPRHHRHHLPDRLPDPAAGRRLHAAASTSASRRRPGTGTSSTWCGCSCSPSSTSPSAPAGGSERDGRARPRATRSSGAALSPAAAPTAAKARCSTAS